MFLTHMNVFSFPLSLKAIFEKMSSSENEKKDWL